MSDLDQQQVSGPSVDFCVTGERAGRCFMPSLGSSHQRLTWTRRPVTRHPSVPQAEKGGEWPENGGEWSDEEGADMDCGLLQAMAEEDEEINVYNEETFGMGACFKRTSFLFLFFA